MMRFRRTGWTPVLAACAALIVIPLTGWAQGKTRTITGTVVDSSGVPIPYANVDAGKAGRFVANDSGRFLAKLPGNAPVQLEVRRVGFAPAKFSLGPGGDSTVSLALLAADRTLTEVKVLAERSGKLENAGFYQRMREGEIGAGRGVFLTQEDIEKRGSPQITNLLEGISGIRIFRHRIVGGIPASSSTHCVLQTYVDGVRMILFADSSDSGVQQGSNMMANIRRLQDNSGPNIDEGSTGLDKFMPSSALLGIEVYPRIGQAPPKYSIMNAKCGVILLWTK